MTLPTLAEFGAYATCVAIVSGGVAAMLASAFKAAGNESGRAVRLYDKDHDLVEVIHPTDPFFPGARHVEAVQLLRAHGPVRPLCRHRIDRPRHAHPGE